MAMMFATGAGTQRRRELREEPRTAAGPVLALDLGATQIRAASVDEDGTVRARVARLTPVPDGPAAIVEASREALVESRSTLAREATELEARLAGIAVSAPGPIDPWRGVIVEPPNLGPDFRDVPIAERLEEALRLPAYLDRDTRVAAMAEGRFGAARGATDYLYVTVSTGVGGAIVSDGRQLMGLDGMAGELGHFPVDFHGPPCGCGAPGHLEAFSSGVAIARAAREKIESGDSPELAEFAERLGATELDARRVAEAEDAGSAAAHEIMEEARRAFAAACIGWVDVFNPEVIVVGGGIAKGQGERLLGPAREAVAEYAFRTPARRVRIVPAELGDDVGLVGGFVLVHARMGDERWRGGRPPVAAARPSTGAPTTDRAAAPAAPGGGRP